MRDRVSREGRKKTCNSCELISKYVIGKVRPSVGSYEELGVGTVPELNDMSVCRDVL